MMNARSLVALLIMGALLTSGAKAQQSLSTKEARQKAFLHAFVYADALDAYHRHRGLFTVKVKRLEAVPAVAGRITRDFLDGRPFRDVPKKFDSDTRSLLFLFYYLGGTLPDTSPCLRHETMGQCNVHALAIDQVMASPDFKAAYEEAEARLKLPPFKYPHSASRYSE